MHHHSHNTVIQAMVMTNRMVHLLAFPTDIMDLYYSIASEATENLHISVGDSSEEYDTDNSQDE